MATGKNFGLTLIGSRALGNEPVYLAGETIGKTTSAAYGYRIGGSVAIAHLQADALTAGDDTVVEVDIARLLFTARVLHGPAFDPAGSRMRSR